MRCPWAVFLPSALLCCLQNSWGKCFNPVPRLHRAVCKTWSDSLMDVSGSLSSSSCHVPAATSTATCANIELETWHRSRSLHEQSNIYAKQSIYPKFFEHYRYERQDLSWTCHLQQAAGTEICEGNKMWHFSEGDGRWVLWEEGLQEQPWPCPNSGVSAEFNIRWHGKKKLGYGQGWWRAKWQQSQRGLQN